MSIVRHIIAILALPFTMGVVIPTLLLTLTTSLNPGWGLPAPLPLISGIFGLGMIVGGLTLVVLTVRLFITVGEGTLAPWDPTEHLVVNGVYRHVRNPMISGMIAVLFGQALLFGSPAVLIWALLFTLINVIYIPRIEEPRLDDRFGADYREYVRHVPRWLPRRTPWSQS